MTYSYKFKRKNDSLWRQYFKKLSTKLSTVDTPTLITTATIAVYILVVFIGAYVLLRRTGILPPNAFHKLLWRIFVYSIPPSLVLALERRSHSSIDSDDPFENENSYAATRTFGAKSLAMKNILGFGGPSLGGRSSIAISKLGLSKNRRTQALPGLFNRDNECYQNSVIQGLASLQSFCDFIERLPTQSSMGGQATLTGALQAIIAGLNSPDNHGRGLWTPWALKSMSSWQQQDAQEYYSRVIDEVEKDIKKALKKLLSRDDSPLLTGLALDNKAMGFVDILSAQRAIDAMTPYMRRNPLEGLQAQRVGCLQCGYVDGLSMIPFNCITLSLGRHNHYDLEGLLNSYTDLETIPGVECAKCTLLKQEKILQRLIESRSTDQAASAELEASARSRLEAVQAALRDEDFSDSTLSKKCQISGKARVLTDKTKQSIIARSPQSLVVHINRSVFDERTGVQLKNYSQVQYPRLLNLSPWCLGLPRRPSLDDVETWKTNPSLSMLGAVNEKAPDENAPSSSEARVPQTLYTLRAVVTHYGTHGDGHYVAWRQDPMAHQDKKTSSTWWRLSDDDVVQFDEDTVLKQGGVFMLFYERVSAPVTLDMPVEIKSVQGSPTVQNPTKTTTIEPESPSNFLSSEMQAALDAKLERYTSPKDNVVAVKGSNVVNEPKLNAIASTMRTASEARPIILEPVGGMTVV